MVCTARDRRQTRDELGAVRGPQYGAVPPYPPQPQQGRCDRPGDVVGADGGAVEVVQNRRRFLADEFFVVRGEQHRDTTVGQ